MMETDTFVWGSASYEADHRGVICRLDINDGWVDLARAWGEETTMRGRYSSEELSDDEVEWLTQNWDDIQGVTRFTHPHEEWTNFLCPADRLDDITAAISAAVSQPIEGAGEPCAVDSWHKTNLGIESWVTPHDQSAEYIDSIEQADVPRVAQLAAADGADAWVWQVPGSPKPIRVAFFQEEGATGELYASQFWCGIEGYCFGKLPAGR